MAGKSPVYTDFFKRNGKGFLARLLAFLAYMGRLSLYTWKQLVKDKCLTSASALAFATLTAVIPVATITFSLYRAFGGLSGFEEDVKRKVFEWLLKPTVTQEQHLKAKQKPPRSARGAERPLRPAAEGEPKPEIADDEAAPGQPVPLDTIARNYAETVSQWVTKLSDQLGRYTVNAVSLSALIIIAVFLMNTIEGAFNDIWHVTHKRRFLYKFVVFWAVVSLGPVLIGASIYLSWDVDRYLRTVPGVDVASKMVLGFLPILISVAAFFVTYYWLPSAKVRWGAALAGAVVAAILWHLAKRGMYLYAFRVVDYTKIYGPIGLALVFMLWLFLTWVIVLFGAEVSYTSQNLHALRYLDQRGKVHFAPLSEPMALRVIILAARALLEGRGPLSVPVMARELHVAEEDVRPITERLAATRLLTMVNSPHSPFGQDVQFVLTKSPETLTVRAALQTTREDVDWALSGCSHEEQKYLSDLFHRMEEAGHGVIKDLTIAQLLRRMQTE